MLRILGTIVKAKLFLIGCFTQTDFCIEALELFYKKKRFKGCF